MRSSRSPLVEAPISIHTQLADEHTDDGSFVRQEDEFRGWVSADGSTSYHLYVALPCPWAHRTIIARKLKKLEHTIGMTVVDPIRNFTDGWAFRDVPGASTDPVNGFTFLKDAYLASDPGYRGRASVPVLWDKKTHAIVSNSDDDIMRMFETEFEAYADPRPRLYPTDLADAIDALNDEIYETVNNGVYRAGFATAQDAYEGAAYALFETLDGLEQRLSDRRYLFGSSLVETDWRLFVTLVRFDVAYVGLFKCNLRRIADYPNLSGYLRDLYQIPGIADTVNFDHIKRGYYVPHDWLNPTRIVPIGPAQDLSAAHGRESLG
jgi:glutathionyl-hydroquinone reductase